MISRLSVPHFALCLGMLPVWAAPVAASPILISQSFTPPPNSGAPSSTTAGASRSAECQAHTDETVVTPLMPKATSHRSASSESRESRKRRTKRQAPFSLTLQDRPSFFWHVKPQTTDSTASFLLVERDSTAPQDQQVRLMYEAELDLPSSPGIVRLDLPEAAPALQPDRQYEWFLSFNCDPISLDSQVHLSGWIELMTPSTSLSQQLSRATLAEQARLLADLGIWQDALMTQIRLRETSPNSVQVEDNWRTFLHSVGLGELATAPLLSVRITEILAY